MSRSIGVSHGLLLAAVLALACALVWPAAIWADSLTVSASENQNLGNPCANGVSTSVSSGAATTTPCFYGTSATGSLATGRFGAAAYVTNALPNYPTSQFFWNSSASAAVDYVYTLSGTASASYIVTELSITGSTQIVDTIPVLTADVVAYGKITVANGETVNGGSTILLPSGASTVQIVTPVIGNVADFSFGLAAFAQCTITQASYAQLGEWCTASADFLDPTTITAVGVYDANGNLLSDASLTSQSGFTPAPISTPEPSALLLVSAGLVSVISLGRKRR